MNDELQHRYDGLKELALREGMALFGVADVADIVETFVIPGGAAKGLTRAVSLGYRLSRAVLSSLDRAPNQLYYFHYQRANILLDATALKITAYIQDQGFNALPIPASQIADWDKQIGALSHREIARRAGLGWYGRNNLMVNEKYGSQVRYATVLTDMPVTVDRPTEGGCGTCRACVTLCPAGAISDKGFNRDACHEKLKDFTKTERIGQMICGVCIKCCPGRK